jgi:hypothetical protein
MSKNYILNLETNKIELHFEKSDYLALSAEQKKELKSSYLWSKTANAWVSRSTNNHYSAIRTAKKLGFTEEERIGERLSYEEQLERKTEKAEHRIERYEQYADNAENRGKAMQSELEKYRGDIAFFTQPIITGHAGSQAFGNRRQKIFDRYFKGFEEYRKSEYFKEKAETAQMTANKVQLKDPVYLNNRIEECNKNIRQLEKNIVHYEQIIYDKNNNIAVSSFYEQKSITEIEKYLNDTIDKVEWEMDKLAFMQNCMDEVGGFKFSKENIQVGYIVKIKSWGKCEIVSAGPKNISFKILEGGASGGVLTECYAAITEVLEVKEQEKVNNPYQVGDVLCKHRPADDSIYKAYQVIKVTTTGVKLQEITIANGIPNKDSFTNSKPAQKKVVKSKYSDWIGVYMDDWQLHKYNEQVAK